MSGADYAENLHTEIGRAGDEIRSIARRQFVASLAAAFVTITGVALLAVVPASNNDQIGQRKFAGVQQPTFVKSPDQRLASAIEVP